ncbi:uncharacterized protein Z518_01889 [Rhinocladiella mackenziei CBS 650.93]|uniref:Alpha-N-acetylglucosaminidase n=1 Tax=Rhinocladiella mackenziei CBS 650.93 TaxID=1442369 RepID=A0A0D2IVK3_9EURO|nr:uncharacterized protein Z518_01889 [Rhinocladiella mackenziei CBS 650.93]KIX07236.1 hypothetical protein Z518_01889 [Rhinocladiella mackenziei CBS 650.93]
MLILDLFSETYPQWQRLNSYYGKPWIWCQLHDFGGNHGLYGQVMNVTINAVEALNNSPSLVGFGLTMEAQEGNEIIYDLWAKRRYVNAAEGDMPESIYHAWDTLLHTVYNNTNLTAALAVTKSIFELAPSATDDPHHLPTTIMYDPAALVERGLSVRPHRHDAPSSRERLTFRNESALNRSLAAASQMQAQMFSLLSTLDTLLRYTPSKVPESSLCAWVNAARAWSASDASISDSVVYGAINQVTLWGPNGEITDYASRHWAGLVGAYYLPRWQMFMEAYMDALRSGVPVNESALGEQRLTWEKEQQSLLAQNAGQLRDPNGLQAMVRWIEDEWCEVLGC